jgi:hypothetical protein
MKKNSMRQTKTNKFIQTKQQITNNDTEEYRIA